MLAFGLFVCGSCFAQDASASKPAQPEAGIRTIYQYKAELGLTDKQESDLKKVLGDFQIYFIEAQKTLAALQAELGDMITKKEDIKKIRKQLEKMAVTQVDASCFDIETSRKVEGIFTPEQWAKWKAIQADFQKKIQERAVEAQAKQAAAAAAKQ